MRKFEATGVTALEDRRGKAKAASELSEGDLLNAKIKLLETQNKRLEMENDLLKKLEEIERRWSYDKAATANPEAHPLFHSDRGYQYIIKQFKAKLDAAKMTQSMSRVGRCIDMVQWRDFGAFSSVRCII